MANLRRCIDVVRLSHIFRHLYQSSIMDVIVNVYLVDGTTNSSATTMRYLSAKDVDGHEVAAVRGVLASVMGMIKNGTTHIAVATDHVIESFRNKLWPEYKTSAGVPPDLLEQFQPLEDVLSAAGISSLADDSFRSRRRAGCRCRGRRR